jgi:hypothetical protein
MGSLRPKLRRDRQVVREAVRVLRRSREIGRVPASCSPYRTRQGNPHRFSPHRNRHRARRNRTLRAASHHNDDTAPSGPPVLFDLRVHANLHITSHRTKAPSGTAVTCNYKNKDGATGQSDLLVRGDTSQKESRPEGRLSKKTSLTQRLIWLRGPATNAPIDSRVCDFDEIVGA